MGSQLKLEVHTEFRPSLRHQFLEVGSTAAFFNDREDVAQSAMIRLESGPRLREQITCSM